MAVTISGLSKTYPNGVQALKNVSLTVGNNMFGLLGPNGAGKSTLMRIVATLQDPDSGSVHFDGLDVLDKKNEVRKILGYLAAGIRCLSEDFGARHAQPFGSDEGSDLVERT